MGTHAAVRPEVDGTDAIGSGPAGSDVGLDAELPVIVTSGVVMPFPSLAFTHAGQRRPWHFGHRFITTAAAKGSGLRV